MLKYIFKKVILKILLSILFVVVYIFACLINTCIFIWDYKSSEFEPKIYNPKFAYSEFIEFIQMFTK